MYDLCFVIDTTASMTQFLGALQEALPEIMCISHLMEFVNRVGVLSYTDYMLAGSCDINPNVVKWSGWYTPERFSELMVYIHSLVPEGNFDTPEAAKTAALELNKVLENEQGNTVAIWYTDAPPHTDYNNTTYGHNMWGMNVCRANTNYTHEKSALGNIQFDWLWLCNKLGGRCRVFPIISLGTREAIFYSYMSEVTNGNTIQTRGTKDEITKNTLGVMYRLLGENVEYDIWESKIEEGMGPLVIGETDGVVRHLISSEAELYARKVTQSNTNNVVPLEIKSSMNELFIKFNTDDTYRQKVYDAFDFIIHSDRIVSLTYNPIFGKFWRRICKSRKDPRRDELVERFGNITSSIANVDDKHALKEFIEMSYNREDVITEMIQDCTPSYPALVLDRDLQMTIADIMDVSRSCNTTVLERITSILTGLRIIHEGPLPKKYIPMAFGNFDLFSTLPHLICTGIMYTMRPAIIMAAVAVYTNCAVLKERAETFLSDSKGRWCDENIQENFAYGFVKLMSRLPQALTPSERDRFMLFKLIGGLQINRLTTLNVEVGFTSKKTMRPDTKVPCTECGLKRSFTLLNKHGICGLCVYFKTDANNEPGGRHFPEKVELGDEQSYWCECKACSGHYAVVGVEDLNVQPKCHFCRNGLQVPLVQCGMCTNKFVSEFLVASDHVPEEYVCPVCAHNGSAVSQTTPVPISTYVAINGLSCVGLATTSTSNMTIKEIIESRSISKVKDAIKLLDNDKNNLANQATHHIHGKSVLNQDAVVKQIMEWVDKGTSQCDTCMFCFTDNHKHRTLQVCSNKKCSSIACATCLDTWYGEANPGNLVCVSNLCCPFCKSQPNYRTLKRHNKQLCSLKTKDLSGLDSSFHHAWCLRCYKLKPCVERACFQDQDVIVHNFVCEDCKPNTGCVMKECPSCTVMVQKTSGCDHISCRCGTHWCFACRYVEKKGDIYKHMLKEHGGYGFADNGADDVYDDYSDDEDNDNEF